MKANQKFSNADEAVSPVIGVILMVAITVVLAAVVFVLVSGLGEGSEQKPNISFTKDSAARTLTVASADPDSQWDDIKFTFNASCTSVSLSVGGGAPTTFSTGDSGPDAAVGAGDKITTAGAGCEVTLTHTPTNQLYNTWKFT